MNLDGPRLHIMEKLWDAGELGLTCAQLAKKRRVSPSDINQVIRKWMKSNPNAPIIQRQALRREDSKSGATGFNYSINTAAIITAPCAARMVLDVVEGGTRSKDLLVQNTLRLDILDPATKRVHTEAAIQAYMEFLVNHGYLVHSVGEGAVVTTGRTNAEIQWLRFLAKKIQKQTQP
jgi:hypothetical protein